MAVERMRQEIVSGRWIEGQELPSERMLSDRLGVARMTLRSALRELESAGVIEHGEGRKRRVSRMPRSLLSHSVGVVSAMRVSPADPHFSPTQELYTQWSAEAALQEAGYNILVVHLKMLQGAKWLQFLDNRPAGLLWTADCAEIHASAAVLEAEEKTRIPVVINSDNPMFSHVDRVVSDHERGGEDLVKWLLAKGCRRLAVVKSSIYDFDWWDRRVAGMRRMVAKSGLATLREVLCSVDQRGPSETLTKEFFSRRVRQMVGFLIDLFQGDHPVDGILAINDLEAVQIAAACRLLGRMPGRDVRIAGYDNSWQSSAEYAIEPVAPCVTIDKDNPAIGRALAEVLLGRIEASKTTQSGLRRVIPHRLVETV